METMEITDKKFHRNIAGMDICLDNAIKYFLMFNLEKITLSNSSAKT